ncbi:MAG: hypothetical protein KC519_09230 [Anaerolineae bacterium]|nr:hypothetical protein [Anaerolineae bacterium]
MTPIPKASRHIVGDTLRRLGVKKHVHWVVNRLPPALQRVAVGVGVKKELVPRERLMEVQQAGLRWLTRNGTKTLGDYLEFGVYQGTSLSCFHDSSLALGLTQMRLFGFDSFEGMPPQSDDEDLGVWTAGQYRSSIDYTRAYLTHHAVDWQRTWLIKGWFCDTATPALAVEHDIRKASFVMIDCDLYSSTMDAFRFIEPMLQGEVVMIFDDWDSYGLEAANLGEKKAFEEFLAEHPRWQAQEQPSYQAWSRVFYLTETGST